MEQDGRVLSTAQGAGVVAPEERLGGRGQAVRAGDGQREDDGVIALRHRDLRLEGQAGGFR